jgi:hypothetical protein
LVAAIGFAMLAMVHPGEAQVPGRGFTALLCLAGIDGSGTYALNPAGTSRGDGVG